MAKRAPRPPRKPPLTAWGDFLVQERLKKGWTQKDAFDHFRATHPLVFDWSSDSLTAYGNLERGPGEPNEVQQRTFLTTYGYEKLPPKDEPTPATPGTESALIAALTAQTTAINGLIERLDLLASSAIRDGVLDALREAGLGPDAGASPSSPPDGPLQ